MINRRKFIKTFSTLGAVVTIYSPLHGCAKQNGDINLAFVPKSLNNPVFRITRQGAEDRVQELAANIGFRWVGPTTTDSAAQSAIIDNLIVQGMDGICVSCNDPDALLPAIDRAVDAGITVITWDSDSPNSKRLTNISIDQEGAGRKAAQLILSRVSEGKCAVLQGTPGALNLEQRYNGFKAEMDTQDAVKIIAIDPCHDDVQRAVEVVEQRINASPELTCYFFVGMWPFFADLKALPNLKAFRERGGVVVSLDALEGALRAVNEGYCDALVGYSWWKFGQTAVDVLVNHIRHQTLPEKSIHSELFVVDNTNISEYWKKQVETNGAF